MRIEQHRLRRGCNISIEFGKSPSPKNLQVRISGYKKKSIADRPEINFSPVDKIVHLQRGAFADYSIVASPSCDSLSTYYD
jgi:hypothetical protein